MRVILYFALLRINQVYLNDHDIVGLSGLIIVGVRSEDEMISEWGGRISPRVSICCATYNQAKYIGMAIDSFLMQETTFPFEILVHDDASHDGTREIVLSYAERFPRLIKPIIQKENQYSKAKNSPFVNLFNSASGDFIAICEGDDYWDSECKLEKQYQLSNQFPEVGLVFHAVHRVNTSGEVLSIWKNSIHAGVIGLDEMVAAGGGGVPTCSMFLRKKMLENLPDWFLTAPVGDYFFQVFGSMNGALFIDDVFSSYRVMTENSHSDRVRKNPFERIILSRQMLSALDLLEKEERFQGVKKRSFDSARMYPVLGALSVAYKAKYLKGFYYSLLMMEARMVKGFLSVAWERFAKNCKFTFYGTRG